MDLLNYIRMSKTFQNVYLILQLLEILKLQKEIITTQKKKKYQNLKFLFEENSIESKTRLGKHHFKVDLQLHSKRTSDLLLC